MKRNLKITAFLLCCTLSLHAQINIFEPCTGNAAVTNVELIGNAYFTGNGSTDPIGSGYLRLTDATNNQAGGAYINQAFPSIMGVVVEFDYLCWKPVNGLMADGASVFLFDGDYGPTSSPPFALGYLGGGLGYAEIGTPGLTGGYIAVGLDEYGTWNEQANPYDVTAPNVHSPNISIRGRTADHTPYLDGILMSSQSFTLEYPIVPTARPLPSVYYRKVQVAITYNAAISKYQVVVSIQREGGSLETIIGPYTMNDAPPPTLKVGLAASTGALNAVHELRNLRITTPGDVRVEKTGTAKVDNGQAATYTVKVYNDAPSDLSGITLTDILPAGFVPYGAPVFSNGGNANNTFVSGAYTGNTYTAQMNIEHESYCTFNFIGHFNISGIPGGDTLTVNNAATVSTAVGYTDGDPSNNTAEVITKVFQPKVETCAGTSVLFEATPTNGGGTPTYQWYKNGTIISGATATTYTYVPANGDVVKVEVTSTAGCASPATVSHIMTVIVHPVPVVNLSASPSTLCADGSSTLTANVSGGTTTPMTYTWYIAGSTYTSSSNTCNLSSLSATGNYSVKVTNSNGCEASATTTVTVNPLPVVSVTANPNPVCSGNPTTFTATVSSGSTTPMTYTWNIAGTTYTSTTNTYSLTLSGTSSYSVMVTNNNGCASTYTAPQTVTVTPTVVPSISINASTNNVCSGTTVTFSPTTSGGGSSPTYQWYVNGSLVGSGTSYTYAPANNDVVTCKLTSSDTCANPNPVTSTGITMIITPTVIPSVTITAVPD